MAYLSRLIREEIDGIPQHGRLMEKGFGMDLGFFQRPINFPCCLGLRNISIFPPKESCTFLVPTIEKSSPPPNITKSLEKPGEYSMNQSFLLVKCRDAPESIYQVDNLN